MTEPDFPLELDLAEVARVAEGSPLGRAGTRVRGLTHDSRRVRPGMLFCALPGIERDGVAFVAEALAAGAAAVLAERAPASATPWVRVADARRALGPLAQRFYGNPAAEMAVVAITGTNGKTTTSFLTAAVLEEALGSGAALGTLGLRRGGRTASTGFTTPEAPELAALLRSLVQEGVKGLAMEVSSHALAQHRVDGLSFHAGVFTNLTHEHLDYHGTLDAYRAAKLRLFDMLREQDAWSVVNLDDPSAEAFRARAPRRLLTYAQDHPEADVRAEAVSLEGPRSRVRAVVRGERLELMVPLGGRFNVSNALAALAVGAALGLAPRAAAAALARVQRVPGRFEIYAGAGRTVLIDYAHTPDAYERVLAAARPLASGELVLVFGCGGERDREKRPLMGEIAGSLADRVFLTADNPRREPLERIAADVSAGLARGHAAWLRLDDRAEAVHRALTGSRPGDLVVLLGKGDEGYQDVNGVKHPYSDREVVRRELAALEATGPAEASAPAARRASGRAPESAVAEPALASRSPTSLAAARVREALGEPAAAGERESFAGVSLDSRSLQPGALFVALKGKRHDGAAFAGEAVRAGAAGIVAAGAPPAGLPAGVAWWTVEDGLAALHRLAFAHRRAMPARVVCVTGSNGKTATKELAASVLAQAFPVARTPGNLNSLVGLPLSLLELSPEHEWGVFELGTNRAGEIARLAALARPDLAVITNVGPSHLEGLGSVEGVLKEKTDLAAALGREGTLVYGGDGERLRSAVQAFSCPKVSFGMHAENDVHPEWAELDAQGRAVFEVAGLGQVRLQLVGLPNLLNALAAIALGRLAGLPPAAIRRGLEAVRPMPLRMDVIRVAGVTVIQDCYKADPDSMLRGVETLRAVAREGRRVAVLGGMRELGRETQRLHYELGRELAREPLDLLVVYGDEALPIARGYQSGTGAPVFLFRDYGRLVRFLEQRVQAPASVLFKASRGVALEQAARAYLGDLGAGSSGGGSGPARAGNGASRSGAA